MEYNLIDSGNGKKFEQFGTQKIIRPCQQAVWKPQHSHLWKQANATFTRDPESQWSMRSKFSPSWQIEVDGIAFQLSPTDFGHLGIFPEQRPSWEWIKEIVSSGTSVLNLFAYSGGSTLAAASKGASVCHLDASKKMVDWARVNASLNNLEQAPIRWIVDDVKKFLKRELRRGNQYDAVILDPPSFGRGKRGEVFKIEQDLNQVLTDIKDLLSESPLFVLLSCHTPGYTPLVLQNLLKQNFGDLGGDIESGEMVLVGNAETYSLPSGTWARWKNG